MVRKWRYINVYVHSLVTNVSRDKRNINLESKRTKGRNLEDLERQIAETENEHYQS